MRFKDLRERQKAEAGPGSKKMLPFLRGIFGERRTKHQKSKSGQKHMSKRAPSGRHSSIVLPSQHERVVADRCRRIPGYKLYLQQHGLLSRKA